MQNPSNYNLLEIRLNDERTQALATIYPARDGDSVTVAEVLERLKSRGVTYGIREQAILDAIRFVQESALPAQNVVVAQGAVPQDGQDAKIRYNMPLELLTKPLPKRADGSGVIDWFALDPAKMIKAGDELATIIPAQPGTPGKTLTWPIQTIPPRPGKPALLNAGQNVRASEDGLRMYAVQDGYLCLQGEQLVVHALRHIPEDIAGKTLTLPAGAIFLQNVQLAEVKTGGFLAIRGGARGCRLRVHGDAYITYAEECEIIADGVIHVTQGLKNCEIITRQQVVGQATTTIVGGRISATAGVSAGTLGASDFTETKVHVGVDRFCDLRGFEIQEELRACEENIQRISQTLKPFVTVKAHGQLTDDKRQLLQKLQAQQRSQEMRIKELHNERRLLAIAAKEKVAGVVTVTGTAHPGVWIGIHQATTQVEEPLNHVRFVESSGGRSVEAESLPLAA